MESADRFRLGGVREGLRREGEGVGVYSRAERRGGVALESDMKIKSAYDPLFYDIRRCENAN